MTRWDWLFIALGIAAAVAANLGKPAFDELWTSVSASKECRQMALNFQPSIIEKVMWGKDMPPC